jgi:drug/metabolite transporter (DMT)-like permease
VLKSKIILTKIYPNDTGTKYICIDALGKVFVYSPVNETVLALYDELPTDFNRALWDKEDPNVFIGITSILFSIFLGGVLSLVNKIMAVEKISLYTQLFYFGIFHCLYSFLWMLFTMDFDYTLGYFFLSALQACLFFLGNYFNYLGLKIIDLSKTSLIQYTKIVFVFLLGSLVLGEKIFFSDIVGSTIIVSFMIYHVMNPIK